MIFANVTGITIPEGAVAKITDAAGTVLWKKPSEYTFVESLNIPARAVLDTGAACNSMDYLSIDFAPIAAALKEIGYKAWFTLEADYYLKEKFNAENVFEGMKDLHTAAVRFEKLFDEA